MERRGIAEAGGAALVSGVLAIGALWLAVGYIDWVLVVGLALGAAIAAAANYRARTGHADTVKTEAPEVTADNFENYTPVKAGDGGTEGLDEEREASDRESE
ncbi:hypothetical protein [Haloarcula salinisoli]|uniref:Uncharacterized protein n=1 Tax=Haloarcula salinisoli TaxID=2487746 RepID=A0A8J8CBF0_9EURY|nr:hypothetical protein [Halomicroarcula salinisoli]MBX0286941.1 hypothetical protein [Halomicroarcula salinisoli]MBX0304243.1 hypothetical protein [Halomicroarcula salinisoli]